MKTFIQKGIYLLLFVFAILPVAVDAASPADLNRYSSWGDLITYGGVGSYGTYYLALGSHLNNHFAPGGDWNQVIPTNMPTSGLVGLGLISSQTCSVTVYDCSTGGGCNSGSWGDYYINPSLVPDIIAQRTVFVNGASAMTVNVPYAKRNNIAVAFGLFQPFGAWRPTHYLRAGSSSWQSLPASFDMLGYPLPESGYSFGWSYVNGGTINMPSTGGRVGVRDTDPANGGRCLVVIDIVIDNPVPVCTLTTSTPYTREGNSYTRLTWNVTNPGTTAIYHNGTRIGTAAQNTNREVQLRSGVNTFTLNGQNSSGSCSVSRSVLAPTVPAPAVTNLVVRSTNPTTNHASNGSIANDSVVDRITWSSSNATSCQAQGFTIAGNSTSGNSTTGITQPASGGSQTYRVRCKNSAGVWSGWRQIVINRAAPATPATVTNLVVRSTNPTTNHSGNGSLAHNSVVDRITWSSANATSCESQGFTIGANATGGNSTTGITQPANGSSQTYRIRCRNGSTAWSAWRSITLSKGNPPVPSVTALTVTSNNPDTGANTNHTTNSTISHSSTVNRITWSSANATSCNGVGFNTGGATSGNVTTGITQPPVNGSTPYRVVCRNDGGQAAQREVVISKDGLPPINLTVRADRHIVRRGDTAEVSVTVNAPYPVSCTINNVTGGGNISHAGGAATTITRTTNAVNNMLPVRVSCTATAPGVSPVEETTYVNIVPEVSEN